MIKRIKRFIYQIFSRKEKYIKTYTYFTFDDYVSYGCSYYQLPTNFEKCKTLDGKLVDIKEGLKQFDLIVETILKNRNKYLQYAKFRKL